MKEYGERVFARVVCALALGTAIVSSSLADRPRLEAPVAIESVTIISAPGKKIESGTILIRDGRIAAFGADVSIPAGTRRLDGSGLVAYAGFLDAMTRTGSVEAKADEVRERRHEGEFEPTSDGPRAATAEANRAGIFARERVEDWINIETKTYDAARKGGFTAALFVGPTAIIGGRASVIQLGDRPLRHSILARGLAHSASFQPPGRHALRERGRYPGSTFAVMAHFRQVMSDAIWYRDTTRFVAKNSEAGVELPFDPDLEALQPVLERQLPLIWEANTADEIHRALNLAGEFNLKLMIVGGREAYKVLDRLKKTATPVLVSLKLPDKPSEYKFKPNKIRKRADGDDSLYGKNWEKRPFEPKAAYDLAKQKRDEQLANIVALEKAGVTWALATYEMKSADKTLKNLAELVKAGLETDVALRGLTTTPAAMFGLQAQLGTIDSGKRANLTILSKPLGEKDAKVRWVFVDGRQYEFSASADTSKKDKGDQADPDSHERRPDSEIAEDSDTEKKTDEGDDDDNEDQKDEKKEEAVEPGPFDDLLTNVPDWRIESEADRDPGFHTGGNVLLKNALVLTVSGDDLKNTSILVRDGKIARIGKDIEPPAGVRSIDLTGFVIMPGMVDPHSHMALSSINEGTLSVTPEVRCEDVVRHDDVNMFRAVAGGTTTIHAMHGSANSIGGQNVMLKLKYGQPSSELIIRDRPRTVKFATGENVKRSGMRQRRFGGGDPSPLRFPGTRMGVETTMRRALAAGRDYGIERAAHEAAIKTGKTVKPMRRDFRLEALADIVNGDIWVHSHCYRADEILRLMQTAEDFGFRIAVLQHVLEGYRIMPEIARHGCGASTFADWWAYKIEAYNAIPQNAGMMLKYGINATVNSDSSELSRHLNFEAAKCMKYSGLTANETLRLVTLNGARQLGLGDRIGSIEIGKEGDLAVFDGHPLDTFSKCVMTFIEGECYFRHPDFDPTGSVPLRPTRGVKSFTAATTPNHDGASSLVVAADLQRGTSGTDGHGTNGSQSTVYAITHATIHPISSEPIPDGTVIINDGEIVAVGRGGQIPAGATVIDAAGRHVYPGLINAGTQVGMNEIGAVNVTVDTSEPGTYQPDVRAASAFNPHSAMVAVTCGEGVLTGLLLPSSPTIAGQAGLVNFDGWTMPEMLVQPDVGLVVNLPSKPAKPIVERHRRGFGFFGRPAPQDEDASLKALKDLERFFRDAKVYADAVTAAERSGVKPTVKQDPRFDAMIPYVLGKKPVLLRADSYKAILEAVMFAGKLELKPIILGGRDAWRAAGVLAKRHIPVIYGGVFAMPRDPDAWDANYRAMDIMARAGVKFCLSHGSSSLAKLLPLEAGFGVAHGLDPDVALRAMTLSAAEILGVADRLGSIEPGKIANLIITTDNPCQATSVVTHAFVAGRPVDLESQHTRFARKFADRPEPNLPPQRELKGPPSQTR